MKAPKSLILIAFVCIYTLTSAQVIYVDDSALGINDGTSWTNAFTDLNVALQSAESGDTIVVAAGSYKPTTDGNRNTSFELLSGVKVLGGFNGSETINSSSISSRDFEANESILNGDIESDLDLNGYSIHIVDASSVDDSGVLDGFTITRGNANGAIGGGGIYINGGSPVLKNLIFHNNYSAGTGAAIYMTGAGNAELGNIFMYNNELLGTGSALYIKDSSPTVYNLTIINTEGLVSSVTATGLTNDNSLANFINCIVWHNEDGDFKSLGSDLSTISHSMITETGPSGTNWPSEIANDGGNNPNGFPLFSNSSGGSPNLLNESPGLNAGNSTYGDNIGYYQGSGIVGPVVVVSDRRIDFGEITTDTSFSMSFTVRGVNLTDDITLSLSNIDYLISLTEGNFTNSSTITLTNSSGTVESTEIFVAFVPPCNGISNGSIDIASTGAPALELQLQAEAVLPDFSLSESNLDFGITTVSSTTMEQFYSISAINLTDNLEIVAPNGFEITLTSGDYSGNTSNIEIIPAAGTIETDTIYVRFNPISKGFYNDKITHISSGTDNPQVGLTGTATSPSLIFVNQSANGDNNGSSWENAFTTLNSAVESAVFGDTVVVAKGIYYADREDRTNSLSINNGILLYGGFEGTEEINNAALNNRDFEDNTTIISADINGDDNGDENLSDNTTQILYLSDCDSLTIIDGFTIIGASGSSNGGGIYAINSSNIKLKNLVIRDNRSFSAGGGIYAFSSQGTIENTLFQQNSTTSISQGGGGAYFTGSGFTIENVEFIDNQTENSGAALYSTNSSITINNAKFKNNEAAGYGGAIYGNSSTTLNLNNSTISNNATTDQNSFGGAMYFQGGNLSIDKCEFISNTTKGGGGYAGALYLSNNSNPSISNSLFCDNSSTFLAGAIYVYESTASEPDGNLNLTNVTFTRNSTQGAGPALYNFRSHIVYINVIAWDNTGNGTGQTYNSGTNSTASFEYSLIENSVESNTWDSSLGTDNGNNLDSDPLFTDIFSCNASLTTGSPALGTGNQTDGNNIGYYQGAGINADAISYEGIYVNKNALGISNGTSWADAFNSLQDALLEASPGSRIFVATGTYTPADTVRNISFNLKDKVRIYGGFDGTEDPINDAVLESRNFQANETILSGDLGGNDGFSDYSENSYHVVTAEGNDVTITPDALLDGFTITGGNADGNTSEELFSTRGGGILIYSNEYQGVCSPTLRNLIIKHNRSNVWGGGVMIAALASEAEVNPIISEIEVFDNYSGQDGGGIMVEGVVGNARPVFNKVLVHQNSSASGGGIHIYGGCNGNADPKFRDLFVCGNNGGGIETVALDAGGSCDNVGGNSKPTFINMTIADDNFVNAAYLGTVEAQIENSIIWGSSSIINGAQPTFTNSIVYESGGSNNWNSGLGIDGGNNLDDDPLFADISICDTTLIIGSPAIGTGDPDYGDNIGFYQGEGIEAPPRIILLGDIGDFGTLNINTESEEQFYSVLGENLSDDITIIPPNGFEISLETGESFSAMSSISLVQSNGEVDTTIIYIRFVPSEAIEYSGELNHLSEGAVTKSIDLTGTGALPPEVSSSPNSLDFGQVLFQEVSAEQVLIISAENLRDDLLIQSPSFFNISINSGIDFSNSISISPTDGRINDTTIYVQFDAQFTDEVIDSISLQSEGLVTAYIVVSAEGIVPSLSINGNINSFNETIVGENSHFQNYFLSGIGLTEAVSIISPSSFEITTDTTGEFTQELQLPVQDGAIDTTVYVRFSPSVEGASSGSILHVSSGLSSEVFVTGIGILPIPMININADLADFGSVPVTLISDTQTYTVSGTDLIDVISISPPPEFEIFINEEEVFTVENPLVISPSDGIVDETTISVRYKPSSFGDTFGVILHSSEGAESREVNVSGIGDEIPTNTLYSKDFKVYPNPTSSTFYISVPVSNRKIHVKMYTLEGRIVYENILNGSIASHRIDLPVQITAGDYILIIDNDHLKISIK